MRLNRILKSAISILPLMRVVVMRGLKNELLGIKYSITKWIKHQANKSNIGCPCPSGVV
jgi:hypothetical protein